jgi:hypothetical protein
MDKGGVNTETELHESDCKLRCIDPYNASVGVMYKVGAAVFAIVALSSIVRTPMGVIKAYVNAYSTSKRIAAAGSRTMARLRYRSHTLEFPPAENIPISEKDELFDFSFNDELRLPHSVHLELLSGDITNPSFEFSEPCLVSIIERRGRRTPPLGNFTVDTTVDELDIRFDADDKSSIVVADCPAERRVGKALLASLGSIQDSVVVYAAIGLFVFLGCRAVDFMMVDRS